MLRTTDLLVLDLDGTLVDTLDDLRASLAAALGRHGRAVPPREAVRAMIGDGIPTFVARGFAAAGLDATAADIDAMATHYASHGTDRSRLYDGATAALDAAVAAGFALAVCTNKPEAPARDVLARLGIADRFACIVGGDSTPFRKPDGRHLADTIARAGGEPARTVMIGDHANDILAARAAGAAAIHAAWGYGHVPAAAPDTARADRWSDIVPLAVRLLDGRARTGAG